MTQRNNQSDGVEERSTETHRLQSEESPELPGLRTWRDVYALVISSFILWVLLLALLSSVFS